LRRIRDAEDRDSPLTVAPSSVPVSLTPHPNSGLPEFGILDWLKSDISNFGWG